MFITERASYRLGFTWVYCYRVKVQSLISVYKQQVGYGADVDEDELMAELEELEQEDLDRELLDVGPTPSDLPEVPTSTPAAPAAAKDEDDELRELENWMASWNDTRGLNSRAGHYGLSTRIQIEN